MKRSTMFTLNLGLSFGLLSRFTSAKFTSAVQIVCPDLKSSPIYKTLLFKGAIPSLVLIQLQLIVACGLSSI